MSPEYDTAARLAVWWLGADWNRDALQLRARHALGRMPQWMPDLVDQVLAEFPGSPMGRRHALAVFIARHPLFTAGLAQDHLNDESVRITHLPVTEVEATMAAMPWPVPVIRTEVELADQLRLDPEVLLWLADPQRRRRRTGADDPRLPYRFRWLDRGSRLPRLLEIPGPLLKSVQRRILGHVLTPIPAHPAAHGFVPGRSAVTHARRHAGATWVVTADLRTFFASLGALRVRGIFATAGYPEAVSALLTGLCTVPTPRGVLAQMPPGGDDADGCGSMARTDLRARLRIPHLAQGAPTSPALSNLIAHGLDRRLTGWAEHWGATYSRYADDLAFSGIGTRPGPGFVRMLHRIIVDEGFEPATEKLRNRGPGSSHRVTGIVINTHPNLSRSEHDRLRATLHDAAIHGPQAANRDAHPDFRAHLEGRVAWAEQLNPVRGHRLRRQLDRITWD